MSVRWFGAFESIDRFFETFVSFGPPSRRVETFEASGDYFESFVCSEHPGLPTRNRLVGD